jgi:hypothetical protein
VSERAPVGAMREWPHNVQAEQALLGAIMLDNALYRRVGGLRAEHFYAPVHARIFGAMQREIEAGRLADHVLLRREFAQDEALRDLHGAHYLEQMARASETCTADAAEHYGRQVVDLAIRRALIAVAEAAAKQAYDATCNDVHGAGQLALLRQNIEQIERDTPSDGALIMFRDCQLDREAFYLIDDLLPRCNMVMTYGPSDCGKTYLWASISIGLGSGRWFHHTTEAGAVLYVAFERPQDVEDRLAALRDELGLDHHLPLALLPDLAGKRLDDQAAAIISRRAKELADRTGLPVRAIVMDTVSAALGGAREDDDGYGRLRILGERIHAETGATVNWIHHEGKTEGRGPRGALQLADACTVWWRIEERESGERVVHVEKANRGPRHKPLFSFRLVPFSAGQDDRGHDIQLCTVEMTELDGALSSPARKRFGQQDESKATPLGSRQKLLKRELEKLAAKHPNGVDRSALKSAFILEFDADRARAGQPRLSPEDNTAAFRKALASFRARKLIKEDRDLIWLVE